MGLRMVTDDPYLRRLALRTLLGSFEGLQVPSWARSLIADGMAGVCVYGYNIATPVQLAALTAELRAARPDVVVAIDEEGGDVTRLGHITGSPYPGNAALGAVDEVGSTEQIYRAIGLDLAACGITLDFAPTVDVNTATDNPIIGTRSFGADPSLVARHSAAAVRGLQSAGVAACAKHFPGHGATTRDSHHELPTVDVSPADLAARDLPPFLAAAAAGSAAFMTGHIRMPDLTGDAPATLTPYVLGDLLRKEIGYTGVVVTDALEMAGARDFAGGVPNAAVLALVAGADLLCIGAEVDADLVEKTAAAIVAAISDGRLSEDRVRLAGDKAATLGSGLVSRLRDPLAAPIDPGLPLAVASKAIRVSGSIPALAGAVVLQLRSASTIAEGRVPWGLPGVAALRVVAGQTPRSDILAAVDDRPVVVVGRHVHRNPAAVELVEWLAAEHPLVLVEMGWPSGWRPAGGRAIVLTYGASVANGRAAAALLGMSGLSS